MSVQGKDYDVLIIGGGIAGVSAAYHLQRGSPEKKMLLVDRLGDVAQGNTALSNAMFRNTFTSADNQTLSDTSINFYQDRTRAGYDLGMKATGYLWVMSERQMSANERHLKNMTDNGVQLQRYDSSDLRRLLPQMRTEFDAKDEEAALMKLEDVSGAVLGVKCGRLGPDKLSRFYADGFRAMGGRMLFNTGVKSLLVEPSTPLGIDGEPFMWQESEVRGGLLEGEAQGEVRAKKVVLAAGVWGNELLEPMGIDGHVKAKKRQMFTISAHGSPKLRELIHTRGFNDLGLLPFIILPKYGCYFKGLDETNEFWVACEDDLNREFVNIPSRNLDVYAAEPAYYESTVYPMLSEYFPVFENCKPSRMWAGMYSYNTLDSIPFVFEEGGVIVVGGGSGSGIMKSDAMGRIVDAFYREGEHAEAQLFGGVGYQVDRLGFKSRRVEREEWVI